MVSETRPEVLVSPCPFGPEENKKSIYINYIICKSNYPIVVNKIPLCRKLLQPCIGNVCGNIKTAIGTWKWGRGNV